MVSILSDVTYPFFNFQRFCSSEAVVKNINKQLFGAILSRFSHYEPSIKARLLLGLLLSPYQEGIHDIPIFASTL